MKKPLIVEVHIQIEPSLILTAKKEIEDMLRDKDTPSFFLKPLYFTKDNNNNEIRICLLVEDMEKLDSFITEKIRTVSGVEATRVRLTLMGEIFPKGLTLLSGESQESYSCHIFLQIRPDKDRHVWQNLRSLKEENGVRPLWIFRDYYDYDRDITLRVVGADMDSIEDYINTVVKDIPGIMGLKYRFMEYMVTVAGKEELLALAKNWVI